MEEQWWGGNDLIGSVCSLSSHLTHISLSHLLLSFPCSPPSLLTCLSDPAIFFRHYLCLPLATGSVYSR